MKLVPDWKQSLRWFSTQGLILIAALPAVWYALPDDTKELAPAWLDPWIFTVLALSTLVGRLVDQK
jgi:hypothetical protein